MLLSNSISPVGLYAYENPLDPLKSFSLARSYDTLRIRGILTPVELTAKPRVYVVMNQPNP